jgi:anti-sigma28 factor (negative regulator of flagellin synthesis)
MKVSDVHGVIRGLDPREAQRTPVQPGHSGRTEEQSADGDALDLSLSAKITTNSAVMSAPAQNEADDLSPQRIADIRTRIAEGHYNQESTLETLAARVLDFYSR